MAALIYQLLLTDDARSEVHRGNFSRRSNVGNAANVALPPSESVRPSVRVLVRVRPILHLSGRKRQREAEMGPADDADVDFSQVSFGAEERQGDSFDRQSAGLLCAFAL